MITELEFVLLKGCILGMRIPLRKSKNLSPLTIPVIVFIATIPLDDKAAIVLILFPLVGWRCVTGAVPLMEYPNWSM